MSPQRIASTVRREIPPLRADASVREAVAAIVEVDVAELPVVDADGVLQGTFGEREFITALFPGYLRELGHAGFVPRSLDAALDKRTICADEPVRDYMNTEIAGVGEDFSDTELAEIFLHHRVLMIPIIEGGRVSGIVTLDDFVRVLGERWLAVS